MRKPILLLVTALLLAGCAKPTEEQRLSKFRGSMKYKAYHFTSQQMTRLAVAEYNKRSTQTVTEASIHSTLGMLWFLAEKSEYSFMESDIAATGATNDIKMICLGLQSVALSKMKYQNLSKSHYDELKTALAAKRGIATNDLEMEHKVMLLSLVAVGLYHGDRDLAKCGADALSAVSQLDYLPPLIGAIVEAKEGSPLKAVAELRALNKNEQFSEHKKALIAEMTDIIASCPDKKTLAGEVMNRVVLQLIRRVLDDIFATDDQRLLLEKTKTLPDLITGKTTAEPASAGDAATSAVPEK